MVEVDVSEVVVGVILSQRQDNNYVVGDWELLVVKLALEEWRLWLEGAIYPFLILTDHWNLEYIRTVWRLNPRHARLLSHCSSRSSGTMAFWRTSFPTVVLNSGCEDGKTSHPGTGLSPTEC